MSVVPPPMSTTMLPDASVIGMPGADRGRHRLFDQVHFAGLGADRAVLHGPPLDLRDLRGHADDDARPQPAAAAVGLADEVRQHLLGRLEVGDDAVAHRLDRRDVARRAPEHLLGLGADRLDRAGGVVDGHDRRLADDDARAAREDAGVGGAEIDGEVVRESRQHTEHDGSFLRGATRIALAPEGAGDE